MPGAAARPTLALALTLPLPLTLSLTLSLTLTLTLTQPLTRYAAYGEHAEVKEAVQAGDIGEMLGRY